MLSKMRRATIEMAARVVVAEREAEAVIVQRGERAADRGRRGKPRRTSAARAATV